MEEADERRRWTLLTSHGHVLVEIARNPQARVRDISAIIGITERATQAIIADLERAGYVERLRIGRRTRYVLHTGNPFRHSAQDGLEVGPFLELLTGVASLTGTPLADDPLAIPLASDPMACDPMASDPLAIPQASLASPEPPEALTDV
ncbi:hypothetical protein Caci_7181 [Catenulispora acidiphila DSM 44928]|uniref:HTH marR-type domain-containing protein n=1 Tax=Catenulispora acidiphila (strain DSM 44928 / JCM 14897 / NBRC 102108 / NRRL B-24433 / ID139908) TaxID=479433 RepID=C7Q6Z7_CATAD|nr:helix-turn-helix domain-containing protein [Catenulispora acidiphila]ACU76010.1 hypothetical protein Caci_7181 [Catenulispora acidiphila DSM 44928]